MGYNIGIRLIDDFLAKSNINACQSFKETVDTISKVSKVNFFLFYKRWLLKCI